MKISEREMTLALATVTTALLAVSLMAAKPRFVRWKALQIEQAQTKAEIEEDRLLIAEKDQWVGRFAELSRTLPLQSADRKMDVHWLSVMDGVARDTGLKISKRQVGKETRVGDMYELLIECREWEGSLESLVRFLFELQREGAMLDIRQIRIARSRTKGLLQGSFSLYCAYRKEGEK